MKKNLLSEKILYFLILLFLYLILFYFLCKLNKLFTTLIGFTFIFTTISLDYILYSLKIKRVFRLLIFFFSLLIFSGIILLISYLLTNPESYHLFFDKIPYIFFKNLLPSLILMAFYYLFDSPDVIKVKKNRYLFSSIILIFLFVYIFTLNSSINSSIFKNYFNYTISIFIVFSIILLRHFAFYQLENSIKFSKSFFLNFFLILLIFSLFFIIILPDYINIKNKKESGGLLGNKIFLFDFNNLIELQEEIKLTNERVLLLEIQGLKDDVNKRIAKGWNRQLYIKRFSLEEYVKNGGFKYSEDQEDPFQTPLYIYDYLWEMKKVPSLKWRTAISQIFYLINIEPNALLGSDLLFKVVPLTNWEGSPFKRIYKSLSFVYDETYFKLSLENLSQENFLKKISPERRKRLLYIGDDEDFKKRVTNLAKNITATSDSLFFKVYAIQEYLRNNYYYSLRPGISKKKNPIDYFLFGVNSSKEHIGKGYCSYFAFSMVILLRSLGIASRVAVGFAPDMENRTLNFYDIRVNDAHAWVEVYFDDYGWIVFDPTSNKFAPGENYKIDLGNKEERNKLIECILKNRDKILEINKLVNTNTITYERIYRTIINSIRKFGLLIIFISIIIIFSVIQMVKLYYIFMYYFTFNIRKKISLLCKHYLSKLARINKSIKKEESILEYAQRIKKEIGIDIIKLTTYYQQVLFREKKNLSCDKNKLKEIKKSIDKDFTKIGLKNKLISIFNLPKIWIKLFLFIFLFLVFNVTFFSSKELKEYLIEARKNIEEGYYDKGLELLNEAEKLYPYSWEANYEKAILYFEHNLFENAIIEFLKSKRKGKKSEELFHYLGDSYGSIGEDHNAVKIYEEAFRELYHSSKLYDKLSWMYYKTHQLEKSIECVISGLKSYPNSSELLMTLGTLYTIAGDYNKAKKAYLEAIESSYYTESNNFRSICYYNLSLLESKFLNYDLSMEYAYKSLYERPRSSAHNQLAQLFLNALDLKKAYNEAIIATELYPITLLPNITLVNIFIAAGKLDDALQMIYNLLNTTELSWMLYFGITKDEYYSELYKLLATCYYYKSFQIYFNDKNDFLSVIFRSFKSLYFKSISFFYELKSSNLSIKIGEKMIKGKAEIEGLSVLVNAYEKLWPKKAIKIIKILKELEGINNPKKIPLYDLQESKLKIDSSFFYGKQKGKENILKNLKFLNNEWNKLFKAEILLSLIKLSKEEKFYYIKELFLLQPSLLPMNGIKLPVVFEISDKKLFSRTGKKIIKLLKMCGFKSDKNSFLKLKISQKDHVISFELYENTTKLKNYVINIDTIIDKKIKKDILKEMFKLFFIIET